MVDKPKRYAILTPYLNRTGFLFLSQINANRAKRIASGLCRDCGKIAPMENHVICGFCKRKRSVNFAKRRECRIKECLCTRCGKTAKENAKWCNDCMTKQVESAKAKRKENKLLLINHFGGCCSECKESDPRVLTLDHVNNDGAYDCRGANGRIRAPDHYARLVRQIKNNQPFDAELNLLCFNCHAKKDLFGDW